MMIFAKYTLVLRTLTVAIAASVLLSGCGIYRINILQGNFLDQAKVDQIEQGMTRNQVKFLLGTPMIADVFNDDRWDYIFYIKNGKTGEITNKKVTVYFDGNAVREVKQEGELESSATQTSAAPQPQLHMI